MYVLKRYKLRIHLWPIIFQEKKQQQQKKYFSDVNCSGHLNCHDFATWCPLSIAFFIYHVISFAQIFQRPAKTPYL